MNADQISEIRPALREVIAGAPDTCATFEVEGNADRWVQVVDCTINCAYSYSDEPSGRLRRLGLPMDAAKIISWDAGKFATFQFERIDVNAVAEWINAYFIRVIGCPEGEYHLGVRFERL